MNVGVIGESKDNGHPYSWPAIINGFEYNLLNQIPFPAIRKYLIDKDCNQVLDPNIKVTKIFCENTKYAKNVAEFSRINKVCKSLEGFSNNLDAIIIAKDDYENHYSLIESLSCFRLPILIDKPIATNLSDLYKILKLQKYKNQFFSCSGLYFSPEINFFPESLNEIYKIKVMTHGPWDRYSIHMINPLEKFFFINNIELCKFLDFKKEIGVDGVNIKLKFKNLIVELISESKEVFGVNFTFQYTNGQIYNIELSNTYKAFSDMLTSFFNQIKFNKAFFTEKDLENTVKIIQMGVNH